MSKQLERTTLCFGHFRLAHDGRLARNNSAVSLAPKELALLRLLASSGGRIVSKQEILDRLWADEDVGEASLTSCIHGLRGVLGDRGRHGRFIETVHGRGYRFTAEVHRDEAKPNAAGNRLRIAIAPFEEELDAEAYLTEGLVADVISRLGSCRTLGIDTIARQSAARLWAAHRDPLRLAEELRLDFVVAGRLRSGKRNFEACVELIRVRDEVVVWSGEFASAAVGRALLAAEIAEALVKRLVEFRGEVFASRQAPPVSQDPRCYRALLRGNFLNQFRTESGLRRSIQCFEQALEWDPKCAAAHVSLAESHVNLGWRGYAPPVQVAPAARAAIARALDIDGRHVGALSTLALLRLLVDWDAGAAEEVLVATEQAEPGNDRIAWLRANVEIALGRFETAVAGLESALEVDPFSPNLMATRIYALWYAGRAEEAFAAGQALAETEPEFATGHANCGLAAVTLGRFDEAIRAAETADSLARGDQFTRATCAWIFAVAGRPELARAILAVLERRARNRYVSPTCLALGYVGLGDRESALTWLERAPGLRCMWFPFVGVDSRFAALRDDPRFDVLQRQFVRPGPSRTARSGSAPTASR